MKKALLAGVAMTMFGVSAASAGAIEDRQAIMKSFRDANVSMMLITRDAYTAPAAAAQFQVLSDGAAKLVALFPEGSYTGYTKTLALPSIWSDAPGFQAALAKFAADAKAAQNNLKDVDSFAATFNTVAKDCDACHDIYRAKPQHR